MKVDVYAINSSSLGKCRPVCWRQSSTRGPGHSASWSQALLWPSSALSEIPRCVRESGACLARVGSHPATTLANISTATVFMATTTHIAAAVATSCDNSRTHTSPNSPSPPPHPACRRASLTHRGFSSRVAAASPRRRWVHRVERRRVPKPPIYCSDHTRCCCH